MLVKLDPEIFSQMLMDEIGQDAGYLHLGAICWLYGRETSDCHLPAKLVRRCIAPALEPDEADRAAEVLVRAGYWERQGGDGFVLVDHAEIVSREIHNHHALRARNRDGSARQRSGINSEVIARDGSCRACGTTDRLTVDHIFPQALGGCRDPRNLQALCKSCNSRKGARVLGGITCCGAKSPRCDGQPDAVTEEQPEQFRNGTGKCRTCSQWEPLGRDWRCKSCAEWDVQEEAS